MKSFISNLYFIAGCFMCWLFEVTAKDAEVYQEDFQAYWYEHYLFNAYQWCMYKSDQWEAWKPLIGDLDEDDIDPT